MVDEPPTLHFFRDEDDLQHFCNVTLATYHAMMQASIIGGNNLPDSAQAVMMSRLIIRMFHYKAERAKELATDGETQIAETETEIDAVWALFKGRLDEDLAEAREIIRKLKSGEETVQ
jgi:hypothetical protein